MNQRPLQNSNIASNASLPDFDFKLKLYESTNQPYLYNLNTSKEITSEHYWSAGRGFLKASLITTGIMGVGYTIGKIPGATLALRALGWTTIAIMAEEYVLNPLAELEKSSFHYSEEYRDVMMNPVIPSHMKEKFAQNVKKMELETQIKLQNELNFKKKFKENPENFGMNLGLVVTPFVFSKGLNLLVNRYGKHSIIINSEDPSAAFEGKYSLRLLELEKRWASDSSSSRKIMEHNDSNQQRRIMNYFDQHKDMEFFKPDKFSIHDFEITHGISKNKREFSAMIKNIKEFGIKKPIEYVEHEGIKYIVNGHHRYFAARQLNLDKIPAKKVALPYLDYKKAEDLFYFGTWR